MQNRILIIGLLLFSNIIPTSNTIEDYSPIDVAFTIYRDGSVKVDYYVETDPSQVRVEIPLFGKIINDVFIVDQDGLPILSTTNNSSLIVDTLGSLTLSITYNTPGLTIKLSQIWSFNVTSTISTKVILPLGATILDLSTIPEDIKTVDEKYQITMPRGNISISYIIGLSSIRAEASAEIDDAEKYINSAATQGIILTEAESLLASAKSAYDSEDYSTAKELAFQTKDNTLSIIESATSASNMIQSTSKAIEEARSEGRTNGLNDMETDLYQAVYLYNNGEYTEALTLAQSVQENVLFANKPQNYILLIGIIVVIGMAVIYIYFDKYKQAETSEETADNEEKVIKYGVVDLKAIFDEHSDLRITDKEVIRYLAEKNGEAFATEIRDRFDMPRSSTWRLIQRLVDEEIAEKVMIGNQTLVRVLEGYLEE